MTCVCGYTRHEDWEISCESNPEKKAKLISENGDEDFIRVNGSFTTDCGWECQKVHVYACPKCGTLRAEI